MKRTITFLYGEEPITLKLPEFPCVRNISVEFIQWIWERGRIFGRNERIPARGVPAYDMQDDHTSDASEENETQKKVEGALGKVLDEMRFPEFESDVELICAAGDRVSIKRDPEVHIPPLGVMPERIWNERRAFDLMGALIRERDDEYGEPGKAPNKTWLIELAGILPKIV